MMELVDFSICSSWEKASRNTDFTLGDSDFFLQFEFLQNSYKKSTNSKYAKSSVLFMLLCCFCNTEDKSYMCPNTF